MPYNPGLMFYPVNGKNFPTLSGLNSMLIGPGMGKSREAEDLIKYAESYTNFGVFYSHLGVIGFIIGALILARWVVPLNAYSIGITRASTMGIAISALLTE